MESRSTFNGLENEYCLNNNEYEHLHVTLTWSNNSRYEITKITKKELGQRCAYKFFPYRLTQKIRSIIAKAKINPEQEIII